MVKAQEWLDRKYPKENRSEVEKIYLNEPSLEGELDLGDFTYKWGVKIYISTQVDDTKLTFKNLPEGAEIIRNSWVDIHERFASYQQSWEQQGLTYQDAKEWIGVGFEVGEYEFVAYLRGKGYQYSSDLNREQLKQEFNTWLKQNKPTQEYLDAVYPQEQRKKITKLKLSYKNLNDSLDVSDFVNLEELVCHSNQLTNLILPNSLKKLYLWENPLTGSLNFLSSCQQLKELNIKKTNFNEVNIDKLPRSLEKIEYSEDSPIATQLELIRWGRCKQCQQPNTSENWCQPCAEKEWAGLEGQELVEKFIQQKLGKEWNKLKWIPYKQFTDIEHLADGGFSKIYRSGYRGRDKNVVLKSLNNSQNITLEFLQEIANTKLVVYEDGRSAVVNCYGISQDPETKNYVMVMDYMEEGNLRQWLQNRHNTVYEYSEEIVLNLRDKLIKLLYIADGLKTIHKQNLIHRDFHSGNILNNAPHDFSSISSVISDLGLSCPVNYQKQEGKIFGVLPYVAPEVLQGQKYTKAADIYGFGIIAYELLANSYPYSEMDDLELAIKVCQGYRPDIDKIPIPQLLKNLIKKCWDADPEKRPNAEKLDGVIDSWLSFKKRLSKYSIRMGTPFSQQYQALAEQYDQFSKSTPYQIHPTAQLTSKMIDTREITQRLQNLKVSNPVDLVEIPEEEEQQETSLQAQIQIPPKNN